jgi:hypothetical protein
VAGQIRVSRRFVTGAGALVGLVTLTSAACDASHPSKAPQATRSSRAPLPAATPDPRAAADAGLRQRAIADERRLLAAAAAPAAMEPFATIRGLHRAHLRTLTGQLPAEPAAQPAAAVATLAAAERAVAGTRRQECAGASAALAPLLASLAASADVAVSLLATQPS